jgi:hypothetical protein
MIDTNQSCKWQVREGRRDTFLIEQMTKKQTNCGRGGVGIQGKVERVCFSS